jgi:hypothetical protein
VRALVAQAAQFGWIDLPASTPACITPSGFGPVAKERLAAWIASKAFLLRCMLYSVKLEASPLLSGDHPVYETGGYWFEPSQVYSPLFVGHKCELPDAVGPPSKEDPSPRGQLSGDCT